MNRRRRRVSQVIVRGSHPKTKKIEKAPTAVYARKGTQGRRRRRVSQVIG